LIVMGEIERLGGVLLQGEMHCFDAGGGDVVEG
jgi:hypothetical protein